MRDWLSWMIGIPGALIIAIVWLGFAGAITGVITGVIKEIETFWGGLLWIAFCLSVMVGLAAFYIWVCERGGGTNVTFP
jgi:hypothetical protein